MGKLKYPWLENVQISSKVQRARNKRHQAEWEKARQLISFLKEAQTIAESMPELRLKMTIYDFDIVRAWFDHYLPNIVIVQSREDLYWAIREIVCDLNPVHQRLLIEELRKAKKIDLEMIVYCTRHVKQIR